MSIRRLLTLGRKGFTLVELMIVIVLIGIVGTTFFVFFNDSLSQYLALQKDGTAFTGLASQSQRLANVLRGLTDITSESANEITCYAYFAPNDTYTSQIHYYLSSDGKKLLADVTPMTANPPIGTLITSQTKTFTIISDFYQPDGTTLFGYLNDTGAALTLPIPDEHSIKGIQVNLAAQGANNSDQQITLQVSLRNRKTNL